MNKDSFELVIAAKLAGTSSIFFEVGRLDDRLDHYIEHLIAKHSDFFTGMEAFAKENNVPIMGKVGIETVLQILRIHQPQSILEVGTAIGYSALRMADTLPAASIVTIERNLERFTTASKYIERAEKSEQIQLIHGDALEVKDLVKDAAPYDAIFIDAAKGQYKKFFELYAPLLSDDGIIIVDNVLFKGLVCETQFENRRVRSLVKKINEFNKWLMGHPDYHTAILPVGDGIAISKKR